MVKSTENHKRYNTEILNALKDKYGYTHDYIRKSLRGDRVGFVPDKLKKEYGILEKKALELKEQSKNTLQETANNIN